MQGYLKSEALKGESDVLPRIYLYLIGDVLPDLKELVLCQPLIQVCFYVGKTIAARQMGLGLVYLFILDLDHSCVSQQLVGRNKVVNLSVIKDHYS